MADPWNLDTNLAAIKSHWAWLFDVCGNADTYATRDEKISAWSVAQHVHHVGIVMDRIAIAIEGMLANPQQGVGLGPTQPFAIPMLEAADIPRGRGKAPEFLHPPLAPTAKQTREQLESARARWETLAVKRSELAACPATFPHFALGHFTAVQWVRFMNVHSIHHFKIIDDIITRAGRKAAFDKSALRVN